MTGTQLLVQRRRALFDRLATNAAGAEKTIIKPAVLPPLPDVQTTIAVIETVLAKTLTSGGAS